MSFRVVCISRSTASGGQTIGRGVSERLGFRYVDEEIIASAAQKANVDKASVAAVEQRQPFIKRLIDSLSAAQSIATPVGLPGGVIVEPVFLTGDAIAAAIPEDYRVLIREAIHEVATQGQAVIVAHAASMALAGMAGVLRVLVTASPEVRARRLAAEQDMTEAQATAALQASDRERRSYFQRFYGVKEELPTHYDLVLNTDVITPAQAVELILCAAQ